MQQSAAEKDRARTGKHLHILLLNDSESSQSMSLYLSYKATPQCMKSSFV